MKRLIIFLFVCSFVSQSNAYEKLSLVERFTNASCAPCAQLNNAWYNATTQNYINSELISHLVYNVNWPGPNDPMYLLNSADNLTRRTYYGVNYVPWIDINGSQISETLGAFTSAVTNGNSQFAPFNIIITQRALGETLIEVGIKIIRDPTDVTVFSNTKLRVALTEKTVSFTMPPGSNGEKDFFSICRKMLPDAGGTTFTIPAPGDSVEVILQYVPTSAFLTAVNLDSIRVVAFIQNDNTKLVYQSAMQEFIPNYVATIGTTSPDIIIENNGSAQFTAVLNNVGILEDIYNIIASLDGPAGWTGEFTTENGTFTFGELDSVQVMVGDSTSISVTVNPNSFNGAGVITLECVSRNDPGVIVNLTFNVVTNTGVHLLVVDASEENYGSIISNSLDGFYEGRYGAVSREALNVAGLDLSYFSMIAWAGGNSSPALYPEEMNNLQNYLDQGGNLLLAAHNLGSDIFEAGGQSQFAQSFFNNYLHSNYTADFGGSYFLTGFTGDPITDGLVIALNSVYTRSPDQISPIDAFTTSIVQFGSGPNINSVKADNGTHRVVYFGFAFEQFNDVTLADTLVRRSVEWLTDGIVLDNPVEEFSPSAYSLEQNYPNPFNPETIIEFQVLNSTPVSIKVYDLIGREIAVLVNEVKQPGVYQVSFDGKNLASGVYFYKMIAGDFSSVKKMNLLK